MMMLIVKICGHIIHYTFVFSESASSYAFAIQYLSQQAIDTQMTRIKTHFYK